MADDDAIVVDVDPPESGEKPPRPHPVVMRLDGVPPRVVSKGWGDMSWLKRR